MIRKLNEAPSEAQTLLSQWVPMPRYLLRCWVVKRLIRALKPTDFIEIGAASGHMAQWMSEKQNIAGIAVEISPMAIEMMRERLGDNDQVQIFEQDSIGLKAEADVLLSMEVLEHIDNDRATLNNWFNLIRPGGHLLLSVPAHPHLFSAEDEMAGHFRRYSRAELNEKLATAGFEPPRLLCYGYPLGFVLKHLRTFVAARKLRNDARSRQQRTEASGVERKQWKFLRCILNDVCMLPFNLMQLAFLRTDLGDGYIAVARKPLDAQNHSLDLNVQSDMRDS